MAQSLKIIRLFRNLLRVQYDFDEIANPEQIQDYDIEASMQVYIAPFEMRVQLMKWLLEVYEPGILWDPDVNIRGTSELEVIRNAFD